MDHAESVSYYEAHGFVVIRGFVGSRELSELTREIDEFIRDVVPTFPDDQIHYETLSDGRRVTC